MAREAAKSAANSFISLGNTISRANPMNGVLKSIPGVNKIPGVGADIPSISHSNAGLKGNNLQAAKLIGETAAAAVPIGGVGKSVAGAAEREAGGLLGAISRRLGRSAGVAGKETSVAANAVAKEAAPIGRQVGTSAIERRLAQKEAGLANKETTALSTRLEPNHTLYNGEAAAKAESAAGQGASKAAGGADDYGKVIEKINADAEKVGIPRSVYQNKTAETIKAGLKSHPIATALTAGTAGLIGYGGTLPDENTKAAEKSTATTQADQGSNTVVDQVEQKGTGAYTFNDARRNAMNRVNGVGGTTTPTTPTATTDNGFSATSTPDQVLDMFNKDREKYLLEHPEEQKTEEVTPKDPYAEAEAEMKSIYDDVLKSESPDLMAMYQNQMQTMIDNIDKQISDLRAQAEKDGSAVDPSTTAALEELRKSLASNITATQEELNRRGLLDSGILLDLEQKLRSGSLSDEQKLLAQRLQDIQTKLNSQITGLLEQKNTIQSNFLQQGLEAQQNADETLAERQSNARQDFIKYKLDIAKQRQQDTLDQQKLAEQSKVNQFNQYDKTYDNQLATQKAAETARHNQALEAARVESNRIAQQRANTAATNAAKVKTSSSATQAFLSALQSSYSTPEQALAYAQSKELEAQNIGVDMQQVYSFINSYYR